MKNSNNKILTIAVILLLLTNIALVVFMFMGKKDNNRSRGRRDPFAEMVKELNMTDQQQKDFKQLKEDHFKNIRPLVDSVRAAKTAFFSLIKEPAVSDSLINVYGSKVTEQQAVLDKMTFEHFRRVRSLFNPEQQPKFDSFLQKMMQRGRRDSSGRDKKSR